MNQNLAYWSRQLSSKCSEQLCNMLLEFFAPHDLAGAITSDIVSLWRPYSLHF